MINLILHITLPAGIRMTTNNYVLQEQVTFDVLSACTPFYASVDQVKLAGGPLIRKLQDITIACQIYNSSQESDLLLLRKPRSGDDLIRFQGAQNQWVQSAAARGLLLNVSTMIGGPGSHVLANFSVTKQKGFESEGVPELLKDLKAKMAEYEITIRSRGRVSPGGHARPGMAAKGVLDWSESTPGRTWITTGMGANASTGGMMGGGGVGRGKAVKFYASPLFSGMMNGYRLGNWQSGSPLYSGASAAFAGSGVF